MHVFKTCVTLYANANKYFVAPRFFVYLAIFAFCFSACQDVFAQTRQQTAKLEYDESNSGPAPVPPAERGLPTVVARAEKVVGQNWQTLEGARFAPNGDLYFCDVSDGKVLRLFPDGKLATVLEMQGFAPCGIDWHRDGRLFVACTDQANSKGRIVALDREGKNTETIIAPEAGFMPNDLVFDGNGGFYFSDFNGSSTRPTGGVYYVSPDYKKVIPVIPNMAQANGVALSPDGKTLWATEYARNLLHRVNLTAPAEIQPIGTKIPYHFIGAGPDSMRVDADGNVYVAMMSQGRVLIFNPTGIPIGQVLLPGREKGLNLRSTSLALHPENKEMRIVCGNTMDSASKDATVFSAPAFAKGQGK